MWFFFSLNAEKRKDPGIPNSLPFKETILREAEERKRKVRFPDILAIHKMHSSPW